MTRDGVRTFLPLALRDVQRTEGLPLHATRSWQASDHPTHPLTYYSAKKMRPSHEMLVHHQRIHKSLFRMLKRPGNLPTIANPKLSHSFTARSFVLTTKLNCIARNPRSFDRSSECKHIARAIPRLCAAAAVT